MIECDATDSDEVPNVALLQPSAATVPRNVEPSMKLTLPVGVFDPGYGGNGRRQRHALSGHGRING